ncbi:MAG TPA: ABC transporter ATP-binding protein [Acidimicrobiales bacterium]|nr:ABC transporter ATP-binding protein [Acidimicrobiales bacterium]
MAAIVVEGLAKRYGSVRAVEDVSFTVEAGEVFALLGPNGAGKTTTLEVLEGFRARDEGRVEVLGLDPGDPAGSRELRRRMGVVLQELAVESFLTVREVLARNAGYFPSPRDVDEVIETVGLTEKANARVTRLSGGQMRRLDLGLGIVGNPELLFLDEPTTGFDPSARRDAWEVVRRLATGGTTVVLTTHYMDEAEALAQHVAVISAGRIVADGRPETLAGRDEAEAVVRFRLPDTVPAAELPVQPSRLIEGGLVELRTTDAVGVLHRLTGWALERGVPLAGLTCERLTLEDVYLRLTGYLAAEQEP